MEENTEAGKPFFIQLSYYALHYPMIGNCDGRKKSL